MSYFALFFRHFDMKLLKKMNYPPYTVDYADTVVLRDLSGVPAICSHDFDKLESGV